jgi:GST-like protein
VIDLCTGSTPKGRKVSIALEELALSYNIHPVELGKDQQFATEFLGISTNSPVGRPSC